MEAARRGPSHAELDRTLRPYLDGNGRLGRLLITLLLRQWKRLSRPLLYFSLFKAQGVLEAAEVLMLLDERKKNRAVVFREYLDYLRGGTEL